MSLESPADDTTSAPVTRTIAAGVAEIRFHRPDRLNAFDAALAVQWSQLACEAVAHPGVRAIVLSGAGRAFCAGGDVRSMAEMPQRGPQITDLAHTINTGVLALLESSVPVIAAAHGTTAGGGLGLLLSSDYAIVGESSRIGSRYSALGLTPDLGVSALLARAVGERRALQLTLSERLLTAREACEWGLVAEVVPDDQVRDRALALAAHWASQNSEAYGETKRLLRSQPTRTLTEQLAGEAETIGRISETPNATQRILAFAAK